MLKAIADTHSIIWHLSSDPRLSQTAADAFERTAQSGDRIGVSSMSLIEII